MLDHIDAPDLVHIQGRPYHLFSTGELLPVIRGGSDDGGDGGDDGGVDDGGGAVIVSDADDPSDTDDDKPSIEDQLKAAKADADKWKTLARKHEKTAKTNSDAAEKLQQLEHAGKSETEKLQAMLEAERTAARTARVEALKLRVAADKGLPPTLAKFLPDLDDEVDMVAAAEDLLEAAGGADTASTKPTRKPKSDVTNPLSDGDEGGQRDRLIAAMTGRSPL